MGVLSLSRLARGFRSPNLFLREANRLYYRRLYTRPYNTTGVDIFEEDWDNLIILDACRYDMFAEQADLPGELEQRSSRSSSTVEFLKANFHGKNLHDTVYVTANPQLYRHRDEFDIELFDVIEVWQEDGWDEEKQTVLPETMLEYALNAAARYPEKRQVIHFIQPHYPFLVDDGEVFDDSQAFLRQEEAGYWQQLMTGNLEVDIHEVWWAYRATLDRALPAVETLLEELNGKTVVTADHGNMVGERASPVPVSEWGHPGGIYTDELVQVPWLVHKQGERPTITADTPTKTRDDVEPHVIQDRLEDLGYA